MLPRMLLSTTEQPADSSKSTDVLAILLVAMPLLALIPKYFLIQRTLGATGAQIFDTGFGFGDYVRSLLTDGSFRSCSTSPYDGCSAPVCNYATRMPGLPVLYAVLTKVVGSKSASVALAKSTATAGLLACLLWVFGRNARLSIVAVVVLYALYFGPQALKHGASLDYEEGLLLDLELCLAVAVTYLLRVELTASRVQSTAMAIIAVLLATAMYFVKATALLTLVMVLLLVFSSSQVRVAGKGIALVCVAVPFALWILHNLASSGGVHVSSSWNGENLYRGASSEALAIYPQISLDRLFDSRQARLAGGRVLPLGNLRSRQCFSDEWAWNDFYSHQARSWIGQHPWDAARFQLEKLWVTVFEVRHTPYSTSADGAATEYPPAINLIMLIWMGFARLVFLVLVVFLIRDSRAGVGSAQGRRALWTLTLLGAAWVPYIAVFGYQRHVVPLLVMAGMLLASLYLAEPRRNASSVVGIEPRGGARELLIRAGEAR